jgi:hypothetical protein
MMKVFSRWDVKLQKVDHLEAMFDVEFFRLRCALDVRRQVKRISALETPPHQHGGSALPAILGIRRDGVKVRMRRAEAELLRHDLTRVINIDVREGTLARSPTS